MVCKECAVEYVQKHNGLGLVQVHSEEFVKMFLGFAWAKGLYRDNVSSTEILGSWEAFKAEMGKSG